ncbi:hypothetical protein D3C76_1614170 [compost metagenome]
MQAAELSQCGSWTNSPRHVNFAAIYNRKLSGAELGLIYTKTKVYMGKRDVQV